MARRISNRGTIYPDPDFFERYCIFCGIATTHMDRAAYRAYIKVLFVLSRHTDMSCHDAVYLGNHFKSGHTLSLQNRPTEVTQNNT